MKILDKIRGRRSEKQLLNILLSNGEKKLLLGLCMVAVNLVYDNIINQKEEGYLLHYIKKHRPKRGSKHFDPRNENSIHYWKVGEWQPRKLWLEDQIKNTK